MISIITSLYNSNKYLDKYIKNIDKFSTVLNKAKIPYELIIVFNSPNDEEKAKLKLIENNKNIRSKIMICERESLYATWNRGIKESTFPNITFWNVDDNRFPDAIIDGLNKINEGFDLIYFPFVYKRYVNLLGIKMLARVKITKTTPFDQNLFLKGMYVGPFFITTKSAFNKVGLFDESFKISGDFEWVIRAVKYGLKFTEKNVIAGIFTNDGTTLSGQKNDLQQSENKRITDII